MAWGDLPEYTLTAAVPMFKAQYNGVVTCNVCGASVSIMFGDEATSTHRAWHLGHGEGIGLS